MTAFVFEKNIAGLFRRDNIVVLIGKVEIYPSLGDLFQSNTRRFRLPNIDVGPRIRAALELLAALRGKDDHSVFGIDHRRIYNLRSGFSDIVGVGQDLFSHKSFQVAN